jgi:AraC-like DNA-binding protein
LWYILHLNWQLHQFIDKLLTIISSFTPTFWLILESTIAYTSFLGLLLPTVLLYFNKGYLTANRYLAGFLFFASLYVLENFYFFYGESLVMVVLFTMVHSFFYLIGPLAFLYMRSILRDNSTLSRTDYLHFALFAISFIGYVPYFISSWDFKVMVGQNLQSENWDITPFRLNFLLYHEFDQVLNVSHTYFYTVSLWYLLWHYKKPSNAPIIHSKQYKLIQKWLLVFASIFTIITINFTVAMAGVWLYDEKSLFLERTGITLLLASLVYIGMNMVILFFPHILYGLPVGLKLSPMGIGSAGNSEANHPSPAKAKILGEEDALFEKVKNELQLFTAEYKQTLEAALENFKERQVFLNLDFKLIQVSNESGIPVHHLTYYFNDIKKITFSDWRNNLRIAYAKELLVQGEANNLTLEAISLQCGFASQSTFIRAFKNDTGTTPSAYLKSIS